MYAWRFNLRRLRSAASVVATGLWPVLRAINATDDGPQGRWLQGGRGKLTVRRSLRYLLRE